MRDITLFIEEDQEILRGVYQSALASEPNIHLLGVSEEQSGEGLVGRLASFDRPPDVVVMSVGVLQPKTVEKLDLIRKSFSHTGVVLLCGHYTALGTRRLREAAKRSLRGCAFLAKYSIDTIGQLAQIVHAVAQGRLIIDSGIMDGFLAEESGALLLKELTSRELDILGLMAKGHKNTTIADILYLEPKTVERHINHIYSKLNTARDDSQQARVHSILFYLRATGQLLPGPVFGEEDSLMA